MTGREKKKIGSKVLKVNAKKEIKDDKFLFKNRLFVGILFCVFVLLLFLTIFVGFGSDIEGPGIVINTITPVYDETSTVKVNNNEVVFNDKNQEVKYNIVLENTRDYDVKVSDIKLSTPTEAFLEYEVENLNKDDVINANSTKELVVSFETVKKDGWGRNFTDELTVDISFAKYTKQEDSTTDSKKDNEDEVENKEYIKEEQKPVVDDSSKEEVTIPDDDLINKVEDESQEEVTEKDEANTGNVVCTKCDVKENDCDDWKKATVVVGIFAVVISIIALILLIILIVVFKKYKLLAGIIIFISFVSLIPSIKAADLIKLPLKFNVAFKSQNVMKPAYVVTGSNTKDYVDYWVYATKIKNIYIQNEIKPIESYSYVYDVTVHKNSRVKAYLVLKSDNSGYYDLYIQADGIIYLNEDSSYYFYNMINLICIDNIQGLDTSLVKNMSYMFYKTGYNNSNFTLDVSSFDTSNVIDMSYMFYQMGYYSRKINTSITIRNSKIKSYSMAFSNLALKDGSVFVVKYIDGTENIVDSMLTTKSKKSHVIKYENIDSLSIGDEILIGGEIFNVISENDTHVTMLAQYNIGTDYKQSNESVIIPFSTSNGWEYTPGPKEVDIQVYGGLSKDYVNSYVNYLETILGKGVVLGNLITLKELETLGCTISADYEASSIEKKCSDSRFKSWIINEQAWWTRSAFANDSSALWMVLGSESGKIVADYYTIAAGIRPTITITREALTDYYEKTYQ